MDDEEARQWVLSHLSESNIKVWFADEDFIGGDITVSDVRYWEEKGDDKT